MDDLQLTEDIKLLNNRLRSLYSAKSTVYALFPSERMEPNTRVLLDHITDRFLEDVKNLLQSEIDQRLKKLNEIENDFIR